MLCLDAYRKKLEDEICRLREENTKIGIQMGLFTEDDEGESLLDQACSGNEFASRRLLELQDPALIQKKNENIEKIRALRAQLGQPVPKTFEEFLAGALSGELSVDNKDDYYVSDPAELHALRKRRVVCGNRNGRRQ